MPIELDSDLGITDDLDLTSIVARRWLRRALSTRPANRAKAERGVRLMYEAAGLPPPSAFVWRLSPLEGAIEALALSEAQEQTSRKLWDRLLEEAWQQIAAARRRDPLRAHLAVYALRPLEVQVGDGIRKQISAELHKAVQAGLPGRAPRETWLDVLSRIHDAVDSAMPGQHDDSPAYHDFLAASFGRKLPEALTGQGMIAQAAGWWWAFENTAILTDRPELLRRDRQSRLHATDGPAIRYRDGWGVWAWHGVRVPRRAIEAPRSLTPDEICAEQDPEVQRAMIERYGAAAA